MHIMAHVPLLKLKRHSSVISIISASLPNRWYPWSWSWEVGPFGVNASAWLASDECWRNRPGMGAPIGLYKFFRFKPNQGDVCFWGKRGTQKEIDTGV